MVSYRCGRAERTLRALRHQGRCRRGMDPFSVFPCLPYRAFLCLSTHQDGELLFSHRIINGVAAHSYDASCARPVPVSRRVAELFTALQQRAAALSLPATDTSVNGNSSNQRQQLGCGRLYCVQRVRSNACQSRQACEGVSIHSARAT